MLKRFFSLYFNSAWLPFLVLVVIFVSGGVLSVLCFQIFKCYFSFVIFHILDFLAFIGMLVAGIVNLTKRRWLEGVINIVISVILLGLFLLMAVWMFLMARGPDSDNFGKDLVIPEGLRMEEPRAYRLENAQPAIDKEGAAMVDIYAHPEKWPKGSGIDTNVAVLDKFSGDNRRLLMRHLATSAEWFLSQENGRPVAYRRFVTQNGRWENTLHGYYSSYAFGDFSGEQFQFYIGLDIDGFGFGARRRADSTFLKVGLGEAALKVKKSINPGYDSYLILESKGPAVEIFEEAKTLQRPLTQLALSAIEEELKALLVSEQARQEGFDPALMPPESIKKGEPEIYITGQLGIYLIYAYINSGEPGYVYLKAFEETRDTPLSTDRIPDRSLEYTGWSSDPGEQFFYNTQITIYEGDWGTHYPARFELWFVPESGAFERKLIEKVFKIEGWQR